MNLFLELRRHGRLADKRHPMYEKSRFARFWMYFRREKFDRKIWTNSQFSINMLTFTT